MRAIILLLFLFPTAGAFAQGAPFLSPFVDGRALQLTGAAVGLRTSIQPQAFALTSVRGWNHLHLRLEQDGISSEMLYRIFSHPALPEWKPLFFSLNPRESSHNYRRLNSKRARANARAYYARHRDAFDQARDRYGVPPSVILAILQVETFCGRNTGTSRVLPALMRLAGAGAPENIRENFAALRRRNPKVKLEEVEKRARTLEGLFYEHVLATIRLAAARKTDPLEIRGSYSGAMGIPQFLPGNHLRYGVDGNRDGQVDLFTPADAIVSVANYLRAHGWTQPSPSANRKREIIWSYNHSRPYVDTVLAMSAALDRELKGDKRSAGSHR